MGFWGGDDDDDDAGDGDDGEGMGAILGFCPFFSPGNRHFVAVGSTTQQYIIYCNNKGDKVYIGCLP